MFYPIFNLASMVAVKTDVEENYVNKGTGDISPVVDAYEHALLARVPRTRYLIGPTRHLFRVVAMLPDWLGDRLIGEPRRSMTCSGY